ncbi:hypothetical protein C8Q78DRAFT_954614, partial [Trametes maxima]
ARSPSELSYIEDHRDHQRRHIDANGDQRSDEDVLYVLDPVEDFPQAQRIAAQVQGQRPRQRDFDQEAREILKTANIYYKANIMVNNAYPDKLTEKTWARSAWTRAASLLNIKLAYNGEILATITQYTWNLRGEIKNAARSAVRGCYGFKTSVTATACESNKARAKQLLAGRAFAYEILGNTPDEHVGLYEAEAIQEVIDRVFYKDQEDDGVVLTELYDPFPTCGLALVLTAIQCAVEEWLSGARINVAFSETAYKPVYEAHIFELQSFEESEGGAQVLKEIRAKISANGRVNAKAPAPRKEDNSWLSQDDISRAVEAYKRRKAEHVASGA